MNDLRDSGIKIIGDISWGTHISHLYSSKEDFLELVVPYIKSGLSNNELCIWIYSQNITYNEIKIALQKSIINIDSYIKKDQLRLIPFTEWYIIDNSFNDLRLNQQWMDLVSFAKTVGFDGLRAVGDTAWLEKCYHRDFEHYEKKINTLFLDHHFIALCLYDISKISMPQVAEIIHNHSFTMVSDNSELKVIRSIELLVREKQLAENSKILNQILNFDNLKTEFFSNISHELRTPLNVILSTLQLIKQFDISNDSDSLNNNADYTKLNKYIKIIQQNCYRQIRLINNLLDISKIDSDYYKLRLQNCNIVNVVENITMSVSDYIENKGISLVFDTDQEELYIACDPDQIERIILNLLSNAIKFTSCGGNIIVTIHSNNKNVIITVEDTGIGIPSDKLDCIFDRFHQIDTSLTRKQEGSGIGLSLVKSLVEKHKGNISVSSNIGIGTKFTINLPRITILDSQSDSILQNDTYIQHPVEKIDIEFSDIYS